MSKLRVNQLESLDTERVVDVNKIITEDQYSVAGSVTTYTPAFASATGTIANITFNPATGFVILGNMVFVIIDLTIVDAGTGDGYLELQLPFTDTYGGILTAGIVTGFPEVSGSIPLIGVVDVAYGGTVRLYREDGLSPVVTGNTIWISGWYARSN